MQKFCFILLSCLLFLSPANSQKVGLVLSGGGAKGLAHLGVIQALEDNNIPIDYITGTSIGAVIGGLYAIGYSPKEMLELFKSEDFAYWQSGEVQENYVYSFKKNEPAPDIFTMKFGIKDSLIIETRYFPSSVVDPIQMNLVFFSIFSQATAASKCNFDSLFVPFRCVASDVYKKEAVVFKNGDLGDAVRASMSFPFVFKPIVINDRLLFDGGIYDNFPVVPLQRDFNPDFIIGSNVAANPSKPNDRNMTLQLQNMIIQHTDYSIKSDSSLLIDFEIESVKLLDFYRADELFQIGYDKTLEKIPELKKKIKREVDTLDLQASRQKYRDSLPELKFKNIIIKGVNNFQKKYISNAIQEDNDFITLEQFKSGYFKLLADKKISEIIPHAVYNEQENCFDLLLNVKLEDEVLFSIGGNISSSVANEAYFGLNYQALSSFGLDFDLSGQFGNSYSSIRFVSQADFTSQELPFYLNLTGNIHTFNYYQSNKPFYQENQTVFYSQKEDFVKLYAGIPVLMRAKMEMGVGYGLLRDYYYQTPYDFTIENEDYSRYVLGNIFLRYFINTLNDKQFPNEGMLLRLTGQAVSGTEEFSSSLNIESNQAEKYLSWMQFRANFESYYKFNKHFTMGIIADGAYSSRKLSNNYIASILQAPSFNPTNHSQISLNEAFSANKYLAAGVKPIYNITRQLAFRGEFYVFAPIYSIEKDVNNKAYYGELFSKYNYLGELSLVFRLPFVSISIYGNHYNLPSGNWNVGFNIGYLIFNNKFLD